MPDVVDHATCGFEKTDPLAICTFWYNNYVYKHIIIIPQSTDSLIENRKRVKTGSKRIYKIINVAQLILLKLIRISINVRQMLCLFIVFGN